MIRVNDNFCKLKTTYLFTEIAHRVAAYAASHPDADIIRMGIGDVTRPIAPAAIEAMHRAVDEMASAETFHGYGPEQGYDFLRRAIADGDYRALGIDISPDEIFISDGAKSDTGNIGDILDRNCRVAVTDPVYPVYVDTNIMAGRHDILYLPCVAENDFCPQLPSAKEHADIIYLCYPNNPTGTTLTRRQLEQWVDYALREQALIMFDSAYEAYISKDSTDIPHSIYEIEGAKFCAIEFRSFSKTAGFTGIRCGYTVVPRELTGIDRSGASVSLHSLWNRRQCTKFNGASYISQCGAASLYTPLGRSQVEETIGYYMRNAGALLKAVRSIGLMATGGKNSPYIWVKTPSGTSSWEMFDLLLNNCDIVTTPGAGFGPSGEGYLRFTAFNTHEATDRAIDRLASLRL